MSLLNVSDSHDIAAKLISDGLLRTDRRGEKQIGKLVRNILNTALTSDML